MPESISSKTYVSLDAIYFCPGWHHAQPIQPTDDAAYMPVLAATDDAAYMPVLAATNYTLYDAPSRAMEKLLARINQL